MVHLVQRLSVASPPALRTRQLRQLRSRWISLHYRPTFGPHPPDLGHGWGGRAGTKWSGQGSMPQRTGLVRASKQAAFDTIYFEKFLMGPSFAETLRMLEWGSVCEHIASFASTHAGRQECLRLTIPQFQADSERLLRDTKAVLTMELEYSSILDFGGIDTVSAHEALARAEKGGMCSSAQLRGIATLLAGVEKLRRQIATAGRQHNANGASSPIWVLVTATSGLYLQTQLVRDREGPC